MQVTKKQNGYTILLNGEDIKTITENRVKSPYDKIFFDVINQFNKEGKQGESVVIQVSENEAMLIYWNKSGWKRAMYPFRKGLSIK